MVSLYKIFGEFFRLGCIAFGGPAAHAALMEREFVQRKKWISSELFLDFLGAVNLIPGPNSTQLTMLLGYRLRGIPGMIAGGLGFVIPAAAITAVLAWLYVRHGAVPAIGSLFFGIQPAVIAVIAAAILPLAKKAIRNQWLAYLALGVLIANLAGLNEIAAILGAGFLGMFLFYAYQKIRKKGNGHSANGKFHSMAFPLLSVLATPLATAAAYSGIKLFWIFFKIGALLFGSGYVLVAYIDGELVEKLAWITREQLLDAIAIGQFTPGPILSAATFIGYILQGVPGALIATLAIFLPSFIYTPILYPIIPRLRKSALSSAFLDCVNVAAVAVMLSVSLRMTLAISAIPASLLILIPSLVVVFAFKKVPGWLVILGGAVLGLMINLI